MGNKSHKNELTMRRWCTEKGDGMALIYYMCMFMNPCVSDEDVEAEGGRVLGQAKPYVCFNDLNFVMPLFPFISRRDTHNKRSGGKA